MKTAFCKDPTDVIWLLTTHLKFRDVPKFNSFVIRGNEDAPDRIDCYADEEPKISDEPIAVYERNEDGHLYRAGHGDKHRYSDREDGLAHCRICNGAEGSLTTECSGVKMSSEREEAVYAGKLDFRNGEWVTLKPTPKE